MDIILDIAEECATAHTEFIDKIDEIAKKYNVPRKVLYELAVEIIKEEDINDD